MHRLKLKHLLAIVALGAAPAAVGGCADNDSALFIRSVIALEAGDCLARSQPDATMLAFGILDTSFNQPYVASLLVGNQLARQGDRDKVRTETSRIQLRGAEVHIQDERGAKIDAFTTSGAGFVDPGSGNEPGYGIMFAELIPAGSAAAATSRVNVSVRVFGETLGGQEIESSELIFPIDICSGCLVSYPADAIEWASQNPQFQCRIGTPPEDRPCLVGQDAPIDCRLCQGLNPACAAVPVTPP